MPDLPKLNKKILIVSSYAPPKIGGGPQCLYHLFSHFDAASYAIFTSKKNVNQAEKGEKTGLMLPCNYYFYDKIRPISGNHNSIINAFYAPFKKIKRVLAVIRMGLDIIRKEGIDIILAITDNGRSFITSFVLSKLSDKPYCLFIMDPYRQNVLSPFWKFVANLTEGMLFKRALKIFVHNQSFIDYYKKIYKNVNNYQIINVSESGELYKENETPYTPKSPYTIIFSGSIYWVNEQSIINLIEAVTDINDCDIKLILYTPSKVTDLRQKYGNNKKILFDVAEQADMPAILSRADILFMPFSWHSKSEIVINTALPAKIISYLASGRPILVHSPAESFVSIYARKYNFAHVVDKEDIGLLREGIKKILTDREYSQGLIENARKTFYQNHDREVVDRTFKRCVDQL
jgi:glycosyltransferase involved in cell wall biosynthesis